MRVDPPPPIYSCACGHDLPFGSLVRDERGSYGWNWVPVAPTEPRGIGKRYYAADRQDGLSMLVERFFPPNHDVFDEAGELVLRGMCSYGKGEGASTTWACVPTTDR